MPIVTTWPEYESSIIPGAGGANQNCGKSPAFGKLVEVVQAVIQWMKEALDKAGHALLNKVAAESGLTVVVSRRIEVTENISPSKIRRGINRQFFLRWIMVNQAQVHW